MRLEGMKSSLFIPTAGAFLLITGCSKILATFGDGRLLTVVDPFIGVQFRHLMLATGLLEIVIAFVCFFSRRRTLILVLIGWLTSNFLVYRLGLWWMDWKKPCNCLGNLTDALHISPQLADNIMKVVLAYLLIGSYGLLFWEWRKQKRKAENRESGNETAGVEPVS